MLKGKCEKYEKGLKKCGYFKSSLELQTMEEFDYLNTYFLNFLSTKAMLQHRL